MDIEWRIDITCPIHTFSVSLECNVNATYPFNCLEPASDVAWRESLALAHVQFMMTEVVFNLNLATAICGTVSDNFVLQHSDLNKHLGMISRYWYKDMHLKRPFQSFIFTSIHVTSTA